MYKYKPSKKSAREFAIKMKEIDTFCNENMISQSSSSDSYYFTINNIHYRVSNHTVESSNRHAYDSITLEKKRELYHPEGRDENTIYITASKTRIIEIYNDLKAGYDLDGRGNRKIKEII